MKTKKLLLFIVIFAISFLGVSAQKLLVSENFSTSAWETEFIRLNPAYTTPAVNTALPGTPGFISGIYNGYELFSGTIECGDGTLPCVDGSTVHNNNGRGVAWRLKNKGSGVSYLTLPTISSAGTFTLHVKTGGTVAANNHIELQRVDTVGGVPVVTTLNDWSLASSGNAKFTTQLDEIKTFWVDSRGPITLRIGQAAAGAGVFVKIFGFQAEEHASIPLKHSVDSATVIQAANAANIGTGYGQYPQEAYDAFTTAISTATTLHDNLASTKTQLLDGRTAMNVAITAFNDSKIVATGFKSSKDDTAKVYCLTGGLKISGVDANTQVSIFSLTGNLVKQQTITDEANIYLPTGSYLVKLQNSNRVIKALVR